jgi:hypothetical protein
MRKFLVSLFGMIWHPVTVGIIVFLIVSISIRAVIGPTTCRDGWHSPSIGKPGACSHHRGVDRTPGTLIFFAALGSGVLAGRLRARTISFGSKTSNTTKRDKRSRDFERWTDNAEKDCPLCGSQMWVYQTFEHGSTNEYFLKCSKTGCPSIKRRP